MNGPTDSQSGRDISAIMRKVHSSGTAPEIRFSEALSAAGVNHKNHPQNLLGNPDVVIPEKKIAVFIDGDFWHGLSQIIS